MFDTSKRNMVEFLPLIYVTMEANPPHLHSSLKFLQKTVFDEQDNSEKPNPAKLLSESGSSTTCFFDLDYPYMKTETSDLNVEDVKRLLCTITDGVNNITTYVLTQFLLGRLKN